MKTKLANNVPHFYISKPFFKDCLYKLEYDFNEHRKDGSPIIISNWSTGAQAQRRRDIWNKTQAFSRSIKRYAKEHKFEVRVRTEGGYCRVFLQSEADATTVLYKFRTKLSAIWMPFNEQQVELIGDDLNATLVFRKTLFATSADNTGYRYKVQCRISNEVRNSWKSVNEFVGRLDEKDCKANDNWYKIPKGNLSYWNTFSMYFNDEQDILMLKLILGSDNFKLQKAVLYSELE